MSEMDTQEYPTMENTQEEQIPFALRNICIFDLLCITGCLSPISGFAVCLLSTIYRKLMNCTYFIEREVCNTDIYRSFINDLTELLPDINKSNNESIISVYLGGSVSRGDYVIGISDIDLYMVVKSQNENDEINNAVQSLAKKELPELLSWCPDGVTVAFTSYQDIKAGTSWLGNGSEYLDFQEVGKLLYGKDIKHEIIAPNENNIIVSSNQAIRQIKQIVQQDVSSVPNKYFARSVFSTAFSAIHFYLCTNKQYLRGKEKTVHMYSELNPSGAVIAKELLSLWHIFSQRELSNAEIARLIDYTRELVNSL